MTWTPVVLMHCRRAGTPVAAAAEPASAYDFSALQYDKEVPLSKYRGQVVVAVNIASE